MGSNYSSFSVFISFFVDGFQLISLLRSNNTKTEKFEPKVLLTDRTKVEEIKHPRTKI